MVSDFSKKQKGEGDHFLIKALSVLFFGIVIILIFANIRLYQKKKELTAQIQNYSDQIKKIESSTEKLKDEIENVDNQDYIEKVAREEQNMQKPGEKVVSFIMPEEQQVKQQTENFWIAGLNNIWQKLKDFFNSARD